MAGSRILRWTALTCRCDGVDVYFGLAATLDDALDLPPAPARVMAFPFLTIRVAEGTERQIPLRYYAIRDPAAASVRLLPGGSPEEGYQRVSVEFHVEAGSAENDEDDVEAAPERLAEASPEDPVMAFVLSVGLDPDEEGTFFNRFVRQFVRHTWMTLPRLLRELGRADAASE